MSKRGIVQTTRTSCPSVLEIRGGVTVPPEKIHMTVHRVVDPQAVRIQTGLIRKGGVEWGLAVS